MDTRTSINQHLQLAWGESNSMKMYDIETDIGRRGIRMNLLNIQAFIDQVQQSLDDLREEVATREEVPF